MLKAAIIGLVLSVSGFANAGLITNGGFETGDFTGWNVTTNGSGGCDTDWNVSSVSSTGCTPVSSPNEGNFAAYNSFDGNGPQLFTLSQSFLVGNTFSSAVLNWDEIYEISFCCSSSTLGGPTGREFLIELFDSNNTLVSTIYSEDFLWVNGASHSSNGWVSHTVDITSDLLSLQGQNVTLSFTSSIRDNFSGPAGFGLDAISLTTSVPEPSTLAIFALGIMGLAARRLKKQS